MMIRADAVTVRYGDTVAVNSASLSVARGESVAIVGASGSGKSTMLHCLAGLKVPDAGSVRLDGSVVSDLDDAERSALRLRSVGLVFQLGLLVPELSLAENVALPLIAAGGSHRAALDKALRSLEDLGVGEVAGRRPSDVSGGEMQRAAIARAVIHEPVAVFADEPTGSLDRANGLAALSVLLDATKRTRSAVVIVTHEEFVAAACDRTVTMIDGALT